MFFGRNTALHGVTTDTQFAARGAGNALALAVEEVIEVDEAPVRSAGNEEEPERCGMKRGDVESPWAPTGAGGVSPLSLLTFFAAAKKVSAAPHRGDAGEPKAKRGCQPSKNQKRQRMATASQTKKPGAAHAAVDCNLAVRATGNRTVKLLPRPSSLFTSSCASCRCSTCLTIASPSPVPPVSRDRLRSTR